MQPELILIQNQAGIDELVLSLQDKQYVTYDTETTGLSHDSTILIISICAEVDKAYSIILKYYNGTFLISNNLDVSNLLEVLKTKSLVMHNAGYDCALTKSNFGQELMPSVHTDTMILAHLLDENRKIGLKDLGNKLLGENSDAEAKEVKESVAARGGSVTKDNYEMYKADPIILGKYAAKDAWMTYQLFFILVDDLYTQKLEKFFYDDECMPLLRSATYEMNTTGLKVDTKELAALKIQLKTECEEDKAFINKEIAPLIKTKYPGTKKRDTFNIGSGQQLAWLLFGEMGLEFDTLTKAGKAACKDLGLPLPYSASNKRIFIATCLKRAGDYQQLPSIVNGKQTKGKKFKQPWAYIASDKKALEKHAPRYKWIARLLQYNKKMKILSTYVEGMEERIRYGIIHPSFLQTGTTSGRYSSKNPNFQNLPRDDKRVKNCIISRPGKVFVGADFSQLEVRVFASVSGDPMLKESFKTGNDFYSVIGMEVFEVYDCTPMKEGSPDAFGEKYKHLRKMSKETALSSTYGVTPPRLSKMIGKSVEETKEIIDGYFEKFPKVREMMLESHKMAKTQGYVTSIFGRPRRLPDARLIERRYGNSDDLPYNVRSILNLAVNHRIQGTAASICNRAMIKYCKDRDLAEIKEAPVVLQVHDEIIVECNEADAEIVSLLLQNAMETAVELPGVELEALPHTAKKLGGLK